MPQRSRRGESWHMRCTRRSAAILAGRTTMITTTRFALVAALALVTTTTACGGADPSGMGGGDGGGSGGGGDPSRPLDPSGTYALHSTFDLATNMPGTAGDVVNGFINATDSADDPSRWIIDQILGRLEDGSTAKRLLAGLE